MTRFGSRCALALVAWLMVTSGAQAQETVNFASVRGQVTDPQGAVVPGAVVTARQTQTNVASQTVTDDEGRFRFPYLRIGPYDVTVHLDGFADATRTLTLTVGSAFDLPLTLNLGTIDTAVTVTASAPVLESARSQIAGTVPQSEIKDLPLDGRNFLDVALLIPGVSPTNTGSNQLFAETSAVPGQGISIGSQRNFSNNFIVDGLSAADDAAGLSGIPYGVDAIEEFQVVTSGGQAELGRALGGYVSIVTKSGTNTASGDLYGYFRDDRLNSDNALLARSTDPSTPRKLPMSQQQFGVSAGGPIARNRTFYFANVEQRRLDQTGLATISDANVAAINTRLAAVGYPGAPVTTGIYANPVRSSQLLGKIDHQISGSDQFGVRYSLYDINADNSRGAGGLNAPSASAGLDNRDQSVAFSNTLTLSARTVNETRAQFAHGDLAAPSTDLLGPAVSILGVATFGTLSTSPQARVNNLFQVVDNLSHQAGSHALRAGIDVLLNQDDITFPRSSRGSYSFASLANFNSGVYNNGGFTQTFGASEVSQNNPNVGVYAQDEWKAGNSLTLNVGLRYDLQFLETIHTDTDNVSPRAGFAWSPSESGRTIVRGSAGLYYDRIPLRALANALLSAGNTADLSRLRQTNISLTPGQAAAPAFPAILAAPVPSVTLVNLTTMDPNIQNAHSRQAAVEVERQLGARSTYSVGYQYVRGLGLIMSINQNVPTCVAAGNNNGCRPNPTYANNSQYSSVGESDYHGLHLSFVQRPSAWGHYRVSYSLSKSTNNVGENFFSGPIDPFDLSKDEGRSDDDQRHRLVINGSINTRMTAAATWWDRVSHGFQVSGVLQSYSPLPFNITSGATTVQGTTGRPIVDGQFIERNAGVGSAFLMLNLRVNRSVRVGRTARLEGLFEIFNVTNHVNVVSRNTNFGGGAYPASPSSSYGAPTAVGDPRGIQLAVRLRF